MNYGFKCFLIFVMPPVGVVGVHSLRKKAVHGNYDLFKVEYNEVPFVIVIIILVFSAVFFFLLLLFLEFICRRRDWHCYRGTNRTCYPLPQQTCQESAVCGQPAIQAVNLTKRYRRGKIHVEPVKNFTADFHEEHITVLVGGNDSGKTTLIYMMSGWVAPTDGCVYVFGGIRQRQCVSDNISMCTQRNIFILNLTVREHLEIAEKMRRPPDTPRSVSKLDVDHVLQETQLTEYAGYPARNLSPGKQRLVCIAMAIVGQPEIILIDDPTVRLDPLERRAVWNFILSVRPAGRAVCHRMDGSCYIGGSRHCRAIVVTTSSTQEANALAEKTQLLDTKLLNVSPTVCPSYSEGTPRLDPSAEYAQSLSSGSDSVNCFEQQDQLDEQVCNIETSEKPEVCSEEFKQDSPSRQSCSRRQPRKYQTPGTGGLINPVHKAKLTHQSTKTSDRVHVLTIWSTRPRTAEIAQIMQIVPSAVRRVDNPGVVTYIIPASRNELFEVMFTDLETNRGRLGIVNMQLSLVRVDAASVSKAKPRSASRAEEEDLRPTRADRKMRLRGGAEAEGVCTAEPCTRPAEPCTRPAESCTRPTEPCTRPVEPCTRPAEPCTRTVEPCTRTTQYLSAPCAGGGTLTRTAHISTSLQIFHIWCVLWSKEMLFFCKTWILYLMILLLAVATLVFGFCLFKLEQQYPKHWKNISLNLDIHGHTKVMYYAQGNGTLLVPSFEAAARDNDAVLVEKKDEEDILNTWNEAGKYGPGYQKQYIVAYGIISDLHFIIYFSPWAVHSASIGGVMIATAMFKYQGEHTEYGFNFSFASEARPNLPCLQPLLYFWGWLFAVFALWYSALTWLHVEENTYGYKHMQLMAGMPPELLWTVRIMWHLILHLIFCALCLIVIVIATAALLPWFFHAPELGFLFVVFFSVGAACIALAYIVSFFTSNVASVFIVMLILEIVCSCVIQLLYTPDANVRNTSSILGPFQFLPQLQGHMMMIDFLYSVSNNTQCYITLDRYEKVPVCPVLKEKSSRVQHWCCNCSKESERPYCINRRYFTDLALERLLIIWLAFVVFLMLVFLLELGFFRFLFDWMMACCRMRPMDMTENTGPWNATTTKRLQLEGYSCERAHELLGRPRTPLYSRLARSTYRRDTALFVYCLEKKYSCRYAVHNVCFTVKPRECFGLVGLRGSGKTTVMNMLAGVYYPTAGDAFAGNRSLAADRIQFARVSGYCPQHDPVVRQFSGAENAYILARMRGVRRPEENISVLFSAVGLKHPHLHCGAYSLSERRRLCLAMALLGQPMLLLLDEPFASLDDSSTRRAQCLVAGAREAGCTVVLASQSLDGMAAAAESVAIMDTVAIISVLPPPPPQTGDCGLPCAAKRMEEGRHVPCGEASTSKQSAGEFDGVQTGSDRSSEGGAGPVCQEDEGRREEERESQIAQNRVATTRTVSSVTQLCRREAFTQNMRGRYILRLNLCSEKLHNTVKCEVLRLFPTARLVAHRPLALEYAIVYTPICWAPFFFDVERLRLRHKIIVGYVISEDTENYYAVATRRRR